MRKTRLQRRARLMGPNLPAFSSQPLRIVRDGGVWCRDAEVRRRVDTCDTAAVGKLSTRQPPIGGAPAHVRPVPASERLLPPDGTPASAFAGRLVVGPKTRGILTGRIGRHGTTLGTRPPGPFSHKNADLVVDTLDEVAAITEVPA